MSVDDQTIAEPEAEVAEVEADEVASFKPLNLLADLKSKATPPSATDRPDTLPLASIVTMPALFQPGGRTSGTSRNWCGRSRRVGRSSR